MENPAKRVLLTANGDEVSKGIAFQLAKCGCRLALLGDENVLRLMAGDIMRSSKGVNPIEVVGLNMEDEMEVAFDEAVDKAWKVLGAVDAFVNCHVYEGKIQDPLVISEEEYKKTVKINLMAPWFLLKAVAKRMRDAKSGGSVVFMTSVLGAERGLYPGAAAFGTCMAGVHQLVRALIFLSSACCKLSVIRYSLLAVSSGTIIAVSSRRIVAGFGRAPDAIYPCRRNVGSRSPRSPSFSPDSSASLSPSSPPSPSPSSSISRRRRRGSRLARESTDFGVPPQGVGALPAARGHDRISSGNFRAGAAKFMRLAGMTWF